MVSPSSSPNGQYLSLFVVVSNIEPSLSADPFSLFLVVEHRFARPVNVPPNSAEPFKNADPLVTHPAHINFTFPQSTGILGAMAPSFNEEVAPSTTGNRLFPGSNVPVFPDKRLFPSSQLTSVGQ